MIEKVLNKQELRPVIGSSSFFTSLHQSGAKESLIDLSNSFKSEYGGLSIVVAFVYWLKNLLKVGPACVIGSWTARNARGMLKQSCGWADRWKIRSSCLSHDISKLFPIYLLTVLHFPYLAYAQQSCVSSAWCNARTVPQPTGKHPVFAFPFV